MQKKILVVEDYEDLRSFMKVLIESYGYHVVEATDGREAVECFQRQSPDLILMDISMPNMDGLSATKAIRKLENAKAVPIIAVSAYGQSFYAGAIEAGCNALINKPVDFNTFELFLGKFFA